MPFRIDEGLYPDVPPTEELSVLAERAGFLARLCASWDFRLLPDREKVEEIRRPEWRRAVDACDLLTSPAYHLLRSWHGLPRKPFLGRRPAYIDEDPALDQM